MTRRPWIRTLTLALMLTTTVGAHANPPSPVQWTLSEICDEFGEAAQEIARARNDGDTQKAAAEALSERFRKQHLSVLFWDDYQQLLAQVYEHPELTPLQHKKFGRQACWDAWTKPGVRR